MINPSRKSLDTEDLENLDKTRDSSLGAYHEALLGLQRNPNEQKKQAARQLLLNYDTFKPSAGQEYMKETELIDQMTKEIDDSEALTAAVTLLGLGDYLSDLKQKNQAFATLMASRTASTQGQVKGAVTAARSDMEAKYQLFRRLLNVAAVYEGDTDYRPFLLAVNAEVEHFKQILARKGVTSGSSSGSGGGSSDGGDSGDGGSDGSSDGDDSGSGSGGSDGGDDSGSGGGSSDSGDSGSGGGSGPAPSGDDTPGADNTGD